jgi:cytochrome c peroxidase
MRPETHLPCLIALILIVPAVANAAAVPMGLPPQQNETGTATALEQVGKQLFMDKRLSIDGSMSCGTCHVPGRHFTDGLPRARGLGGRTLSRRTPSLLNVAYATTLFWDGRAADLVAQIRTPLLGPIEHGMPTELAVAKIVQSDAGYADALERLLGVHKASISIVEVGAALAAYERTLLSADSPFDRYVYGHDAKALSPAALRGLALFRGQAQCVSCHTIGEKSALLTDQEFHASPLPLPEPTLARLGELADKVAALRKRSETDALNALVASDQNIAALGRFVVTLNPKDIGCFKTPSLRNVALLGPYMHDGSVQTLAQAIELELYGRSARNYPLVLTEDERADLLHFLEALTSN